MKKAILLLILTAATFTGSAQSQAAIDSLAASSIRAAKISNDPVTGFGRVAIFEYLTVSARRKQVHVGVKVLQYKNDTLVEGTKPVNYTYTTVLRADNSQWVDTLGNDVPTLVPNPDTLARDTLPYVANPDRYMKEYEFYIMMADNPVNIFDLVLQQILIADTRKRYDE